MGELSATSLAPTTGTDCTGRAAPTFDRHVVLLLIILVEAFALRLYQAAATVYIWDETWEWLPLARSVSFHPGSLHLPVRGDFHPALPAYFIHAGQALFGDTILGSRIPGVVLGTLTVLVLFRLVDEWLGGAAPYFAAVLLGFNEYHIAVSAFAIEKAYSFFFASLALYCYSRFLRGQRPRFLCLSTAAMGLAFLCNEAFILLLPACFISICFREHRHWLRRREPYLAALLLLAVIAPDLLWNLAGKAGGEQAGYGDHLQRMGRIGLSYHPFAFYGYTAVRAVLRLMGREIFDPVQNYPAMNLFWGSFFFVGVCAATLAAFRSKDAIGRCLGLAFCVPFCFFTLARHRLPWRSELDPVAWFWVDMTLLAAVPLTAFTLAGLRGRWRLAAVGAVAAVAIYSGASVASTRLGLPAQSIEPCPPLLWPPDGRMAAVKTVLRSCPLCPQSSKVELEEVLIASPTGTVQGIGSGDVEGGSRGDGPGRVYLRAVVNPDGTRRPYYLIYRLTAAGRSPQSILAGVYVLPQDSRNPVRRLNDTCAQ